MLKAIATGLALTMMLVGGCSSDSEEDNRFSCENAKSKCPSDPVVPAAECNAALSHPTCGTAAMALFFCVAQHQTCGSDGKTDQPAIERACAMQLSAVQQCSGPGDAGSD